MSDSRQGAVTDPSQPGLPRETVVCLGSSTTASRGTYKWIDELKKRPQNKRFRFVNLGVGGDLSFNTVGLLDRVVALQPDRVIVLIGTNDIMATYSRTSGDSSGYGSGSQTSRRRRGSRRTCTSSCARCGKARIRGS